MSDSPLPVPPDSSDDTIRAYRPFGGRATDPNIRLTGGAPPGAAVAPSGAFGRYELQGELGRGGMGVVYTALDRELKRTVALKVCPAQGAPREVIERFMIEAQTTSQLEHPNIVPIYDSGVTPEEELFYTMKLVRGRSLTALLKERVLALPRLLNVFRDVANGIAYAHARGVIHRDLKPDNIMVGEFGEVLVMDWGLARIMGAAADRRRGNTKRAATSAGRTLDGEVMGTPLYMAPEQARGDVAHIDARTDVYALGAILYRIVAGRAPIRATTASEAVEKAAAARVEPLPRGVPAELVAIVTKAMARERENRYATAAAMAEDVRAYLEGRAVGAATYTPWALAGKWVRRNKLLTGGIAAALLTLAGGVVASSLWAKRARETEASGLLARARDGLARGDEASLRGARDSAISAFTLDARRTEAVEMAGEASTRLADLGRRVAFDEGVAQARRELEGVPTPEQLREGRDSERQESTEQREARERALAAHLAAAAQLDRALAAVDDAAVRAERVRVGLTVIEIALLGRDYTLARHHATQLANYGGDSAAALERIRADEEAEVLHERERLERMIEDIQGGLDREGREPGAPVLEDYVIEASSFRREQTVEFLQATLEPFVGRTRWTEPERVLVAWAGRVLARLRLRAADELAAELTSRGLDLAQAAVGYRLEPWEEYAIEAAGYRREQTVRRMQDLLRPYVERARSEGQDAGWTDAERRTIRFACRVLGRLNMDLAVAPLVEWLGVIGDDELAVECGIALCNTRREEAQAPLLAAQDRLGLNGDAWRQIAPFFARVPEPEEQPEPVTPEEYNARGLIQYNKQNYAEAIEDFGRAIELNPRDYAAYTNRGFARRDTGDLAGAAEDWDRAVELNPTFAEGYTNRGFGRRESGDLAGAIEDFDRAIELNPQVAEAYFGRGIVRYDSGDLAGAIEDNNRAIELNPRDAEAYGNRALARSASGDLAGAIEDYGRAIDLDPRLEEAFNLRGTARYNLGDFAGAIEDHTRAIELEPRYAAAYNSRGLARSALGDPAGAMQDYDRAIELNPRNARAYNNRGNARSTSGDLAGAIEDYGRMIEISPQDAMGFNNRGIARSASGDLSGAIEDFDRAIRLNPRYGDAYSGRGLARMSLGDDAGAIEDYDRAIELIPQSGEAYTNRGAARGNLGDSAGAIEDFDRAIELNPRIAEAYFGRGFTRSGSGDLAGAIEDYGRAIELNPRYARAYYSRATARSASGDPAGAIEDYGRAIELNPRDVSAYNNRGVARSASGDLTGAIEDYGRVIELNPQEAVGYKNRGAARHASGDLAGAIQDYDRAIDLDPGCVDAYVGRGLARSGSGDSTGAMEDYDRAIDLDARSAEAYTNRGAERAGHGDLTGADEDLRRALDVAPPNWAYRATVEGYLREIERRLHP